MEFHFSGQKAGAIILRILNFPKVRKVRFVSGNCNPKTVRGYANGVLFSGNETNFANFSETKTSG